MELFYVFSLFYKLLDAGIPTVQHGDTIFRRVVRKADRQRSGCSDLPDGRHVHVTGGYDRFADRRRCEYGRRLPKARNG